VDIPIEGDDRAGSLDLVDIRDPASFGRAYEVHWLAVYRYLRARAASEDDALDLTATTFERAFAARSRFRPRDGGLAAWLFRIARNAAIDAHRREPQPGMAPQNDDGFDRLALASDRDEQGRANVRELVRGLPADQREAVLLRYAGGLTAREIGAVLGKSEAAAQKQIQRALVALREAFNERD
jgi:RNA polymerase sigma-70 factor, ECF subfamily